MVWQPHAVHSRVLCPRGDRPDPVPGGVRLSGVHHDREHDADLHAAHCATSRTARGRPLRHRLPFAVMTPQPPRRFPYTGSARIVAWDDVQDDDVFGCPAAWRARWSSWCPKTSRASSTTTALNVTGPWCSAGSPPVRADSARRRAPSTRHAAPSTDPCRPVPDRGGRARLRGPARHVGQRGVHHGLSRGSSAPGPPISCCLTGRSGCSSTTVRTRTH